MFAALQVDDPVRYVYVEGVCIDWKRIQTSYVCKTTQWEKKWGDYENRGEREGEKESEKKTKRRKRRKEETREMEWEKRIRITEREMRREKEGERKEKLRKVELNTMVEWNGLCDTGPDVKQHTHEMESDLTMKASLSNNVCSSPFS